MAGEDVTQEAEQRLAAALERIADVANQGLSRAAPLPSATGSPPDSAAIVARLDSLIERLRSAVGQHAAS